MFVPNHLAGIADGGYVLAIALDVEQCSRFLVSVGQRLLMRRHVIILLFGHLLTQAGPVHPDSGRKRNHNGGNADEHEATRLHDRTPSENVGQVISSPDAAAIDAEKRAARHMAGVILHGGREPG
jgi:hypothetical protein